MNIEQIKEKIKAYYIETDIDKVLDYINNLQQRIDKAIEYIKNEDIDICTIRNNDIVDTKNELLEILGEKE